MSDLPRLMVKLARTRPARLRVLVALLGSLPDDRLERALPSMPSRTLVRELDRLAAQLSAHMRGGGELTDGARALLRAAAALQQPPREA